MKILFILSLLINLSFSLIMTNSTDDEYKIIKTKNYQIVYTDDYIDAVKFIKKNLDNFIKVNNKSFGYSFNQPLLILLVSNNIQQANAYSTVIPFNLGGYFNGGSAQLDSFSSKSWLKTLFVHEIIHNYQSNPQKSKISQFLYKYFGSNKTAFGTPFFYTYPSSFLSDFFSEGNAVLNETLYKSGGRLYNGRLNALKNSLVFHNKTDSTRLILGSNYIEFPYGQRSYIVGGFYMKFLAQKYGIDKVNQFFYEHSDISLFPFLVDNTYKRHFNTNFKKSIKEFNEYTKDKYKDYKELVKENQIAHSKFNILLSKYNNKIYFITSNGVTQKSINIYDIQTKQLKSRSSNVLNGKIIIKNNKIYTSSGNFISPGVYKNGLFDEDGYLLEETSGKVIKDLYKNKELYVDTKNSFINTKLYLNKELYDTTTSNPLFDKDGNIYYFKFEDNKNRKWLYKNRQKIFFVDSYYAEVVDIKDDIIFFISNTKNGSGLYKYENQKIYLINESDNIVNAKFIENNKFLVSTIEDDGYGVYIIDGKNIKASIFKTEITNNTADFEFDDNIKDINLGSDFKKYGEISEMRFHKLSALLGGGIYSLEVSFMDPMMFNEIAVYGLTVPSSDEDGKKTDDGFKMGGIRYNNQRYLLPFSFDMYGVDRDKNYSNSRSYGASFEVDLPLIKKGFHSADLALFYNLDDKNRDKNPVIFEFLHNYGYGIGFEYDNHMLSYTQLLAKYDRSDKTYGFRYFFDRHLFYETYFHTNFAFLNSDTDILKDERGIEVVNNKKGINDNTSVVIEGLNNSFFAKDIKKYSVGLSKTLNFSKYFYPYPSLRRESIFYTYNQFELEKEETTTIKENIIGIKFDIVFSYIISLPVTIKYIKNDFTKDDYKIKYQFELGGF